MVKNWTNDTQTNSGEMRVQGVKEIVMVKHPDKARMFKVEDL